MSRVRSLFTHIGSTVLTLALIACWIASAGANFKTVQIRVGDGGEVSLWVLWAAAIGMDVLKAGALVAIRYYWEQRPRKWMLIGGASIIWALTMFVAIVSCFTFLATTFSDTTHERGMHQITDRSIEKEIGDQQALLIRAQERQLILPTKDAAKSDAIIAKIQGRLEELRARVKTERGTGAADPLGELLLAQFGWPMERVQFWILFSILLAIEVAASVGFMAFTPMLFIATPEVIKKISPNSPNSPKTSPPAPRRSTPRIKAKPRMQAKTDQQLHAERFLVYLIERFGEAKTIASGNLFSVYQMWCAKVKEAPIENRKLGLALSSLGCYRDKDIYVLPLPGDPGKQPPAGGLSPAATT